AGGIECAVDHACKNRKSRLLVCCTPVMPWSIVRHTTERQKATLALLLRNSAHFLRAFPDAPAYHQGCPEARPKQAQHVRGVRMPPTTALPEPGRIVHIRQRQYLIEGRLTETLAQSIRHADVERLERVIDSSDLAPEPRGPSYRPRG